MLLFLFKISSMIAMTMNAQLAVRMWLGAKSEWFSAVAGECVTNGEVLKAHAVAVVLLVLAGIGGAL